MGRELPPHFLRVVPYYSIESWLYLNHQAAQRLVGTGQAPATALEWLESNRDSDGGYDTVDKPKASCPLGDRWNLELAGPGWPREEASSRSPSFRSVIEEWGANASLVALLRSTNPWLEPEGSTDTPSTES